MHIKYLTRQGNLIIPENRYHGSHQENLDFLNNHPEFNENISREVGQIVTDFLRNIESRGKGYLNSGKVAHDVCEILGYLQDKFHHGIVGSALNRELEDQDSDYSLIASKDEGQTWFDYFVPNSAERKKQRR